MRKDETSKGKIINGKLLWAKMAAKEKELKSSGFW